MSYQPHSFVYKAPPLTSIQPQCSLQRDSSLWGGTTSSYHASPLPSIPPPTSSNISYNTKMSRIAGDEHLEELKPHYHKRDDQYNISYQTFSLDPKIYNA